MNFSAITPEMVWVSIGFLGQAMFFMRFFVQWLASEKAGASIVPDAFWYFSILGGLILFTYAVYRQDPVFILGQSTGLFIYARNLQLIRRKNKTAAATQPEETVS
jgi:lipid-A-disaccharide synthase-like uncharacterized protein